MKLTLTHLVLPVTKTLISKINRTTNISWRQETGKNAQYWINGFSLFDYTLINYAKVPRPMGVSWWQTASWHMIPYRTFHTHTIKKKQPMNERGWTCTYFNTCRWDIWEWSLIKPNIMSRPGNCQEVQNICDDKTATAAVHLDPNHQPRHKSVSAQNNYSTWRLARAHAPIGRQAHFFLFF